MSAAQLTEFLLLIAAALVLGISLFPQVSAPLEKLSIALLIIIGFVQVLVR